MDTEQDSRSALTKCRTNDFCLALCCALSVTVISAVVFWLDNGAPALTSEVALREAQRTISDYCARNGMASCDLKLVDASSQTPQTANGTEKWNFEFYSPGAGPVTVQVKENPEEGVQATLEPGAAP